MESLGFGGEESAGASFLRRPGAVWTTDKDGLILGLLAAEMTARTGRDPGELYRELTRQFGEPVYERIDAPASAEQKAALERLTPREVIATTSRERKSRPCSPPLPATESDRRPQGGNSARLVCGPPFRHGGRLQTLCGEFS